MYIPGSPAHSLGILNELHSVPLIELALARRFEQTSSVPFFV